MIKQTLRRVPLHCFSPVAFNSETLRVLVRTLLSPKGDPERQAEAGGTAEWVDRILLLRGKLDPFFARRPNDAAISLVFFSLWPFFHRRSLPAVVPFRVTRSPTYDPNRAKCSQKPH